MDGLHNQVDNPFISTAHQKFLNWRILLWEERPNIGHNYWSNYTRLKLPLKCYSDYLYWAMNTSNWREVNKSLFVSFIWSYFSLCLLWFLWTSGLPRGNLFILLIETFFLPVYIQMNANLVHLHRIAKALSSCNATTGDIISTTERLKLELEITTQRQEIVSCFLRDYQLSNEEVIFHNLRI